MRRDDVLRDPQLLDDVDAEAGTAWWRVVAAEP
jgi:hypothetical protein